MMDVIMIGLLSICVISVVGFTSFCSKQVATKSYHNLSDS